MAWKARREGSSVPGDSSSDKHHPATALDRKTHRLQSDIKQTDFTQMKQSDIYTDTHTDRQTCGHTKRVAEKLSAGVGGAKTSTTIATNRQTHRQVDDINR